MSYRCPKCFSKSDCYCDDDPNELHDEIDKLEVLNTEVAYNFWKLTEKNKRVEALLKEACFVIATGYPYKEEFLNKPEIKEVME